MDMSDPYIAACSLVCLFGGCSAIAGYIAFHKRRSPYEGVLLGLFLGPIGVYMECQYPYQQRPPVDKKAWNSLRSMMDFQESGRETLRRRSTRAH